jgi:hypothetical protein
MLDKMGHVVSNPTTSDLHRAIIGASFGPIRESQLDVIKANIQKMKDANVRLRTTPAQTSGPRFLGTYSNGEANVVLDSVRFSHTVHSAPDVEKAGVLIHQTAIFATHANSNAATLPRNKMGIPVPPQSGPNVLKYTGPRPRDPAEVEANEDWASIRHRTVNMEQCAEAFRVMAHLCDATISDTAIRDTALSRRALLEGDKEAYHSILLRRKAACCRPNKNTH